MERKNRPSSSQKVALPDVFFVVSLLSTVVLYSTSVMDNERMMITIQGWKHLTQSKKELELPGILQRSSTSKYHDAAILNAFIYGIVEGDKENGTLKNTILTTVSEKWIETQTTRIKVRTCDKWVPGSIGMIELWMAFYGSDNEEYLKVTCEHAKRWPDALMKDFVSLWHSKYVYESNNSNAACHIPGHTIRQRDEAEFYEFMTTSEYWIGRQATVDVMMAQMDEDERQK